MKYEREYAWEAICEEAIKRFEKQYQTTNNPAYKFFLLCHEHYTGFFLLCRHDRYRSAQTLLLPMFQALLRGWWLSRHASEREIKKFVKRGKIPRMSKLAELILSDSATHDERFRSQDIQRLLNAFTRHGARQPIPALFSEETSDGIRSTAASTSYFAMLLLAGCIDREDVVELLENAYSDLMAHYVLGVQDQKR